MLRQADASGVANARYQLLYLLSWSWIPLNIFLFRCRAQETWRHWFLYHRVSKNGVPGAFVIFVLYLLRTFSNTLMKLQLPLLPCCLPGCNSWHWSSASGEILHLSMLSCQIFFLMVFLVAFWPLIFEWISSSFVCWNRRLLFATQSSRHPQTFAKLLGWINWINSCITSGHFQDQEPEVPCQVLIYFWPFETKGSASLATVICTLERLERIVTLSNYEPLLKVLVPTETSQEREASSSNSFITLGLGPWNVDVWFSSLAIILTQQLQNSLAIIKVSDQSLAATGQRGKPSGPGMVLKHFHKDQSRLKSRARKWTC